MHLYIKTELELVIAANLAGQIKIDRREIKGAALRKAIIYAPLIAFKIRYRAIIDSFRCLRNLSGIYIAACKQTFRVITRIALGTGIVVQIVEMDPVARLEILVEHTCLQGEEGLCTECIGHPSKCRIVIAFGTRRMPQIVAI